MKLAWQNIIHDRIRFGVAILGIGFAVCLMVFQGSLLFGFLRAASKLVRSTDSDIWVTARGVVCFDFPGALPERFVEISRGVSAVERTGRIVTSFAEYRMADGRHQLVAVVGADPEVGEAFPVPYLNASSRAVEPDTILVDRSNRELLGVGTLPAEAQINQRQARVVGTISGFGSFLGCPYVFASYADALRYLRIPRENTMYIVLRLRPGYDVETVKRELQSRLPEADVWTRDEFAGRSQLYWITQTGAGAGILAATALGFPQQQLALAFGHPARLRAKRVVQFLEGPALQFDFLRERRHGRPQGVSGSRRCARPALAAACHRCEDFRLDTERLSIRFQPVGLVAPSGPINSLRRMTF